jgi:hypothetical protein
MIAEAFSYGTRAIANASTDNITLADGALDADRSMYLKLTGGGQACTVSLLPNTVSKVWLIENATSATLTFTQGSGANVAVLAGQVKMIATDGAGSGAVVYDLLTDVNLAGTTVTDIITANQATVDDIDLNGKVITMTGSSGDTATLTVAADGALAIATTDAAAAAANISITADGTFTATGTTVTLTSSGALSAAGTTITLDSAGDIILDADGADVIFKDGGTAIGTITNASSDLVIKSNVQDKDILLKGDDGGTEITALSLDMSEGGNAVFSGTVTRDLTRGSIDVGNSSGVSAPLAAGGADTVLTSDGTDISWAAAGSSGRTLISTTTISDDANVLIEGLDSTYGHYQFVMSDYLNATGNNGGLIMRYKSGGSVHVDTVYRYTNIRTLQSSSSITIYNVNGSAIELNKYNATAAPAASLIVFDIFNAGDSTNSTTGFSMSISPNSATLGFTVFRNTFVYEPATAVTGVQFVGNSGNMGSGTIKLYGIS